MTVPKEFETLLSRRIKQDKIRSHFGTFGGVSTTKELFSGVNLPDIGADFRWKSWSWPGFSVGECHMNDAGLVINTDGGLGFSSRLSSDGGGDSWGILHFNFYQDNGVLLWSSGQFWSPTIPTEWSFSSGYPQFLFDYVNGVSMTSHC